MNNKMSSSKLVEHCTPLHRYDTDHGFNSRSRVDVFLDVIFDTTKVALATAIISHLHK